MPRPMQVHPTPQPSNASASEEDNDQLPPKRPREEEEDQLPPKRASASSVPSLPMDQVLDNVLEMVLQFLDESQDRSTASLVCRSWHCTESTTRESVVVRNILAASAPTPRAASFSKVTCAITSQMPTDEPTAEYTGDRDRDSSNSSKHLLRSTGGRVQVVVA